MNNYITTEELKREIERLGLEHKSGALSLYIEDNGHPVANVHIYQPLQVDTCYDALNYKNPTHLNLYNLLDRYARTPVSKRYTQKKYRLRLDIHRFVGASNSYFSKIKTGDAYLMTDGKETTLVQAIFTQTEIDKMGDLTKGFVKEEVCEN